MAICCVLWGAAEYSEEKFALPGWIERWDGLDVKIDPNVLERYSYSDFIETDIEAPGNWQQNRRYDAILVIHVLEHLLDPEAALRKLLALVEPGGILMGGSPTMPSFFVWLHERQLRQKNATNMHDVTIHKHLSVVTPSRIRRFCRKENLNLTLLAGTFLYGHQVAHWKTRHYGCAPTSFGVPYFPHSVGKYISAPSFREIDFKSMFAVAANSPYGIV